jgi:hypothetical protein
MSKTFSFLVAGAIAATTLHAAPVEAQSTMQRRAQAQDTQGRFAGPSQPGNPTDQRATSVTRETPSRLGRHRRVREEEQPAAADPARIQAEVAALITSTSLSCQVGETKQIGVNAEQQKVYETSCASGPGYILVAATPPLSYDCIELAAQAEQSRARDPNVDVGMQCSIEANLDVMRVVRGYAQEAGVACNIDEGALVGKSGAGNNVYEVGCADTQGLWIEKAGSAWTQTECLQVKAQGGSCRFTTPQEEAAAMKAWLAGSEAASCNVEQVRLMGQNANGRFYEAKCTGADGVIARLNAEHAVQQVYPCATAQQIGGGCTLTSASAAAPATTEPQ